MNVGRPEHEFGDSHLAEAHAVRTGLRCLRGSGRLPLVWLLALACGAFVSRDASAQFVPGDGVPAPLYFKSLGLLYDGEYSTSAAAFLAESRSGIKSPSGLWIDSICYFSMAG